MLIIKIMWETSRGLISANMKIGDAKKRLASKLGCKTESISFYSNGIELRDDAITFAECGVADDGNIEAKIVLSNNP